jgi:NAD(P)-dependent dehydrogenase (short-subunit alcohol dehydrogenase family)
MLNVLVTGANRGIGLAITKLALDRGDKVFAACRNPSAAEELFTLQQRYSNRCIVVALDVVHESSLQAAASQIQEHLDLLVCNAGLQNGYGGMMGEENTMDAFRDVLTTNIASPFFTTRYFLPHLRKSASAAKVAVISSLMGSQRHSASNAYAYRASKAGANNIVVTLSHELRDQGIAVAAYHPGWVITDMGGPNGDISAFESATGLLQRFDELTMAESGNFINYNRDPLPL